MLKELAGTSWTAASLSSEATNSAGSQSALTTEVSGDLIGKIDYPNRFANVPITTILFNHRSGSFLRPRGTRDDGCVREHSHLPQATDQRLPIDIRQSQVYHEHVWSLFDCQLQTGRRIGGQQYMITSSGQRSTNQFEVFDVIVDD
jgi:hypothetical protein